MIIFFCHLSQSNLVQKRLAVQSWSWSQDDDFGEDDVGDGDDDEDGEDDKQQVG